jgi:hypothetical protein
VVADLLTVVVLALVGTRLLAVARVASRGAGRRVSIELWRSLRPRDFALAIPVLIVVATAASLLISIPGLSWGWWTAIGGEGNPVVGSTDRTAGSPLEWLVPLAFLLLLLPGLPLLVENEERVFRRGSEARSRFERIQRGVVFGLAHALIGIPIGVALALSLGGWWFTWVYMDSYRRAGATAALHASSRAHLAYNTTIVVIVLLSIAAGGA